MSAAPRGIAGNAPRTATHRAPEEAGSPAPQNAEAPRGTTGEAPFPPADLHGRKLPILAMTAIEPLYRVHRTDKGAVFFGPVPRKPPAFRFDSISGRFGVLYAAPGPDAAMIETILRSPERLTVDYSEIADRSITVLSANRDLRLVAALEEGLSCIGTTAAISTGPYDPCGMWSDALFDHPEAPDGIAYASRHNPKEICFAIFERPDIELTPVASKPLPIMRGAVGALLDRHGKSLTGVPDG